MENMEFHCTCKQMMNSELVVATIPGSNHWNGTIMSTIINIMFDMETGLVSLVGDNSTESGHTINVIHRFNIFQEIILAVLYQLTPFQVI